jgi:hypothetical protein
MQGRGLPPVFAAAQHFATLPAAGQLPAAVIQPDAFGFRQLYFPPTMDVDLAFVPVDEIGALVEESLALPPIDLEAQAADIDATGILILVPVTRQRFQRFDNALPSTTISTAADPGAAASKPAFDLIATLVARRRKQAEAAERDAEAAAAAEAEALRIQAWHAAFQEAVAALPMEGGRPPLLWYTRRRSIDHRSRVTGVAIAVTGDDVVIDAVVNENLARLGLESRLANLNGRATPQASARMISLLGAPSVARSDILTAAVIADLERVANEELPPSPVPPAEESLVAVRRDSLATTTNPAVLGRLTAASSELAAARTGLNRVALSSALGTTTAARADTKLSLGEGEVLDIAQDYGDPRLGEGLSRLDKPLGEEWPPAKGAIWLGGTGKALELDGALRALPGEQVADFAELIGKAVDKQDAGAVDKLLEKMR